MAAVGTVFCHAGHAYELPPVPEWPISAALGLTNGDLGAVAGLVGDAAFARLLADGFTLGDLHAVMTLAIAAEHATAEPVTAALGTIRDVLGGSRPDPAADPLLPALQRLWDEARKTGDPR